MKNILTVALLVAASLSMFAVGVNGGDDDDMFKKGTGKVYVFGFSHQLADSVAYITDIQEIDSMDLDKKTKFLPYRSEFSLQFKQYLEGTEKLTKQTSCVYYSAKRQKLEKTIVKLKKRYIGMDGMKLVTVGSDKFKFKHPFDSFGE